MHNYCHDKRLAEYEPVRIGAHSQALARARKNRCELVRFGTRPQPAARGGAVRQRVAAAGRVEGR
jgi:hypothetical protein